MARQVSARSEPANQASDAPDPSPADESVEDCNDDAYLDIIQRAAVDYFLRTANPVNGLVPDTSRIASPCSIAVVGFALSVYPIAVERGWTSREEAVQLSLAALRFFRDSDQSGGPDATGYKGFYYHFLDMQTGKRVWRSELSMIDTALLLAGVLTAAVYFDADTAPEHELRQISEQLYLRVDWRWSQHGRGTIMQGWKPESGFLHYGWEGYSESILLYVLARGAPAQAAAEDAYEAWTATYQWENIYDIDILYAGPLFIHQFSHAWIDFRGIQDSFMRTMRSDYFKNSHNAVRIQREYARRNPLEFAGYDENCWGFAACDGPTPETVEVGDSSRRLFGYAARGVPYGPDDGTIAGWSTLASLPFAPAIVMQAVRSMQHRHPCMMTDGCYASSFNPGLLRANGQCWSSPGHYGLDQGIVAMMIENHRSGLIWRLMRACPWIATGLRRSGFRGGWL